MKKTKKLAVSAVLSALGVALLFLGGLLGVLDISSACIVSFAVLFIYTEVGWLYAVISYAVISVLGFILGGTNLFAPFCFLCFFGPMALTKYLFEKTGKVLSWILKLSAPMLTAFLLRKFLVVFLEIPESIVFELAYYALFFVIIWLTHLLYISLTRIYMFRYREKIIKFLK